MPIPLESTGIHRNPQESTGIHRNPLESTGIGHIPVESGIRWNIVVCLNKVNMQCVVVKESVLDVILYNLAR
jgi:hypothetical protein